MKLCFCVFMPMGWCQWQWRSSVDWSELGTKWVVLEEWLVIMMMWVKLIVVSMVMSLVGMKVGEMVGLSWGLCMELFGLRLDLIEEGFWWRVLQRLCVAMHAWVTCTWEEGWQGTDRRVRWWSDRGSGVENW